MKKAPLKYILLLILSVAVVIVSISCVGRYFINKRFVSDYNKGIYDTKSEGQLLLLDFPEGYIPYYNIGNAAFMKEQYVSAVSYYTDALVFNPKEPYDCQIRINLALALCYTIDFDNLDSEEKVQSALYTLFQARDTLLQNGCAVDEEGCVGHNEDAQQLKEDIDEMIKKLQQGGGGDSQQEQDQNQQGENQEEKENNSGGSSSSNKQKQQQEALEQSKKGAMQERQEEIGQLENYKKYNQDNNSEEPDDSQKSSGGNSDPKDNSEGTGGNGGSEENGGSGDDPGDSGQDQGPTHPW